MKSAWTTQAVTHPNQTVSRALAVRVTATATMKKNRGRLPQSRTATMKKNRGRLPQSCTRNLDQIQASRQSLLKKKPNCSLSRSHQQIPLLSCKQQHNLSWKQKSKLVNLQNRRPLGLAKTHNRKKIASRINKALWMLRQAASQMSSRQPRMLMKTPCQDLRHKLQKTSSTIKPDLVPSETSPERQARLKLLRPCLCLDDLRFRLTEPGKSISRKK